MTQRTLKTTSAGGLDHDLWPMKLWHKAKRLGIWDPRDIDFTKDREDWLKLNDQEREVLLHLTTTFLGGEESVVLDLLPLMMAVAQEGRLEEEIFLTSFLWEEAKHVEVFRRWLDEVAQDSSDLTRFHTPNYRTIFYDELPSAMNRLLTDRSPEAQAIASTTYNMIVEGTLAETGYHAYLTILKDQGLMPGMQQVVANLNRDESRHIAYGVYLLSRLVAEHGEPVWEAIEARMGEMFVYAMAFIDEVFECYEVMPFGMQKETFTDYAMSQFQKRFERIAKARGETLKELQDAASSDAFFAEAVA
jgi:ribonucleoside-diphosphate reductase beta chain